MNLKNTLKRACIYVSASPEIGAGHAVRSSVLADALMDRGWECIMVTDERSHRFFKDLSKYERLKPPTSLRDLPEFDLLVIDDYGLGEKEETEARENASKILVIEDQPQRKHDCDYLLDTTYQRQGTEYKGWVPSDCTLLTGSAYSLIRKDIRSLRHQSVSRLSSAPASVKRILVSFGAGFHKQMTMDALQQIKAAGYNGAVDVVLGLEAPPDSDILALKQEYPFPVSVHINPKMETLLAHADLAIGAAGSSTWERSCLGIPQLLRPVAENQSDIARFFPDQDLNSFLNLAQQQQQSDQAAIINQTDGLGVFRILNSIDGMHDKQNKAVSHRKVLHDDMEQVHQLHDIPEIRHYSHSKERISLQEHKKWFLEKLAAPLDIFELILCDGCPCGTLRLDYQAETDLFVLSYSVVPEFQGRGIGQIILEYAKQLAQKKPIRAFVYDSNERSHYLFKKANFSIHKKTNQGIYYEY